MKFSKSIYIVLIGSMILCFSNAFAASLIVVPNSVSNALTIKYPKAEIKKWTGLNGNYIAEAKEGHRKLLITFDQNGNWLTTTSKIRWSWNLPANVRATLKNSKYAAWKIDGIKEVDSSSESVYQLCVDDQFLHRDGAHALVFTHSKVLTIKVDGVFASEQDIESPLLF